ncbi:MAG: cytidylate kinase [Desulfobacterales bacterium RIFOXYA12_FULL_46_15]|nr:MAG: cytidylate kinase [Desulfobacterales bacterium RIFOXYA12_FULL_46_15]
MTKRRPIHKLIDEQIKRWELGKHKEEPLAETRSVITISRESGSQGLELAGMLSKAMEFDLFDNEILEAMIEASRNSRVLLETLDEKKIGFVDDLVSSVVNEHHLWPDEYSKLLLKIIGTIGKHGRAVIVGRGANFVLTRINALRIRIVAPFEIRKEYIMKTRGLSAEDAKKYVISTDSNRNAFVKRYFNYNISEPSYYDMVLNTGTLSLEKAVMLVREAL